MRPYLALTRAMLRSALRYRITFLMGMFGMFFQLIALFAVWRVLLDEREIGGFGWAEMRPYLLIGFTCGMIVSSFTDWRMAYRIVEGTVSLDLVKPVDYQFARFAEIVGGIAAEVGVAVVLWAGVLVFTGPIALPPPELLALFALSMLLVVPLKFLFSYVAGLGCFWTHHYNGIRWTQQAVVAVLSGMMIPLALLPSWLATTAAWLPFAGVASTPGLIFIGRVDAAEAARLVAVQAFWIVVLWLGARLAFRGAVKQLTVHGG
ncbi:ABC transporter permease [Spirilliplanes yamanashiensis]|uniref:ABC transporter permease n=1 Tax=Spirilliplanes yamanashiensis TaxID=42233 RepID=A0A8J3Y9K6_9ACTN|nr:ABC-2 family transporter protein [Spirilliplanes yamanashiensis]MDP9815625.1 ABC-2 type transport system permease protein [Spirilliplanes yamanashiensis]GIJ03879.1 hypothetical protein Sya03_32310 [Spirilliplanes yamanashiensis]